MISLVKYKIKWVSNIAIDTETCDWVGRYLIRPSRSSYAIKYFFLTISRNNNLEVLVLFLINNAILRRRKKLLLYLQRYLSHIELHI